MKLEERAINCKHWRWMPGMLARYSDGKPWYRLTEADSYGIPPKCRPPDPRRAWPDLTDPATLGCLLGLVRDAYRDAYVSASSLHDENGYWGVRDCDGFVIATGRSEREALVIALEKADAE